MLRRLALSALLALAAAPSLAAQLPVATDSALRRVFASGYYRSDRFGPARWIERGTAYSTIEPRSGGGRGFDLVRYQTATGERSLLVSASQLTPPGTTDPLELDDYAWSPDATKLLVFTNTRQVWRQNTRGDYWVLDRGTGALRKLGGANAPESSLMYAKFSPQGDRVAYVMRGDLYVERLADGRITRLTTGADSLHVNGMSDWVYEEEFSLRDGFRWSPDGAKIAFWHFDMTGVSTFVLVNYTDSIYPKLTPIQYPKAGTTNSGVTAGVVSADGGAVTWLQLPGDPRDNYLPWMEWADANQVLVQRMNRLQNTDDLLLADAASGATKSLMVERDSAWVDLVDDVRWLKNGSQFLWTSERDGWRHLWVVPKSGAAPVLVTPGNFDVIQIGAVDEAAGWVYYAASPDNATQRYLYRSRLDGKGKAERLTPADKPGTHNYSISPDAKWALHFWSSFDAPPRTELVSLPAHATVRSLIDNAGLAQKIAAATPRPTEFFKVALPDGASLDGWMIKPRDFDSTKTYPILMYVYGEPAGQTVTDAFSSASLWYHAIADQGYLVASVDNRGTPAPKGRAWRKSVYQQIGVLSSAEQADAVRALAKQRAYVDATRVAIWGWSGGGSSTLQAMFRYPDVYHVGMSVAPVPDQRLYDSIYQERYMGLPSATGGAYDAASPLYQARGLRGKLLLVHGSGDDNVHFQGSQRMLNELVRLGKPIDFMEYPNRSHCICEGAGTTLHVYSLLTRYLFEHLPAGAR